MYAWGPIAQRQSSRFIPGRFLVRVQVGPVFVAGAASPAQAEGGLLEAGVDSFVAGAASQVRTAGGLFEERVAPHAWSSHEVGYCD